MSKERARRREAREAERAAALAEAERQRARAARRSGLRHRLPHLTGLPGRRPPRPARYGALPTALRVRLAVGWLAVQLLAWRLSDSVPQRVGIAVLSLLALPLVVVLTVNTASRRSPTR